MPHVAVGTVYIGVHVVCQWVAKWCVWYVYGGVLCMWGLVVICICRDDVQWLWVVLGMFIV